MARHARVTLSTEHTEVIAIEDDYRIDFDPGDGWLVIDGADGSMYAFPLRLVVAVVVQGRAG